MSNNIIDNGTYTCQAVSFEFIEKEGKEPSIGVKLRVVEGPDTGKDIFEYLNLNGGAAEISMKTLRSLGWTCNDITVLEGLGSTKVIVKGKGNEYNGKLYQKWSIWPMRVQRELAADVKASFAERFRALAASAEVTRVVTENAAGPLPEAKSAGNGTSNTKPVETTPGAVNF